MILVFWRPQDWLLPWLFGWPLLDVIAYAALLSLIMESSSKEKKFPWAPAIFLSIGLWIASIFSHVPHTYFQGIMDTIPATFKPCFFCIMLVVVISTPRRARIVCTTMVVLCCFMAIHAILQRKTGVGFAGQPPMWCFTLRKGWVPRSVFFGIFEDPNDLAQMLASAIPLGFAMFKRQNVFTILIGIGIASLLIAGLMTTESRGGQIAMIVALGLMVILAFPARWIPYLFMVGIAGFLVFIATQGGSVLDASARERVVYWGLGNRAFKSAPIFGIGYNMFWSISQDRAAHNAFVGCYTEIGLFGYWFWYGLLQSGFIGCWKTRVLLKSTRDVEEKYVKRLAGLSLAAVGGFAAGAYFLSRTFVFPLFFFFGLLGAIPLLLKNFTTWKNVEILSTKNDIVKWCSIGTVASVIYIYISILLLNR